MQQFIFSWISSQAPYITQECYLSDFQNDFHFCKCCWWQITDLKDFHNVGYKSFRPSVFANLVCTAFEFSFSCVCHVYPYHFCIVSQLIWSASLLPIRSPCASNSAGWTPRSGLGWNPEDWGPLTCAWACRCENLCRLASWAGRMHCQCGIAKHHLWFSRTWSSFSIWCRETGSCPVFAPETSRFSTVCPRKHWRSVGNQDAPFHNELS